MKNLTVTLLVLLAASCSSNKYAVTNRSYKKQAKAFAKDIRKYPVNETKSTWVGTTNFGLRKPSFVIIHHTAQNSCEQTLRTFTLPRTQVSAHYVICHDGKVHHMLNDYLRAWHAGAGSWGNDKDINSSSIGIELDNNGFEPFSSPQLNSLLILLDTLKNKYKIPAANFIGHADIAPTRKNDPNVQFPWQLLAEKGYGLWYRDTSFTQLPADFNALRALRIIGYSTRDSAAAFSAFRRHFLKEEKPFKADTLSGGDKKILYDLMEQYN